MKEILSKVTADKVAEFWKIAQERCNWSYDQLCSRRREAVKITGAERYILEQIANELSSTPI